MLPHFFSRPLGAGLGSGREDPLQEVQSGTGRGGNRDGGNGGKPWGNTEGS